VLFESAHTAAATAAAVTSSVHTITASDTAAEGSCLRMSAANAADSAGLSDGSGSSMLNRVADPPLLAPKPYRKSKHSQGPLSNNKPRPWGATDCWQPKTGGLLARPAGRSKGGVIRLSACLHGRCLLALCSPFWLCFFCPDPSLDPAVLSLLLTPATVELGTHVCQAVSVIVLRHPQTAR
jgi:hypothetical protein